MKRLYFILFASFYWIPISSQEISFQPSSNVDDFNTAYYEFGEGVSLYNKKQYKQAIDAFLRCDSLMYFAKGEDSSFFGHGMQWIASCYYKMGIDSLAKQYSDYYNLVPIDMRMTIVSDSILDVAQILYNKGEIEASLKKYIEASEVEKRNLGRDNYWYANTLSYCADLFKELGEDEKAIELEKEALNIREKSLGVEHVNYYYSLKDLFNLFLENGNNNEIIKYGELLIDYMDKYRDVLGTEYYFYPGNTCFLARTYAEENNYTKALYYCNKTIESADLWIGYPNVFTTLYHNTILTLKVIEEDGLLFELCNKIISIYEKEQQLMINENCYYADILNIYASLYTKKGDYISACVYEEKALNSIKEKNSIYNITITNLAKTYCELGRYEEAIKLAKEAVLLCEEDTLNRTGKQIYAESLISLAHCYSFAGRLKDALRIGKRGFILLKDVLGLNSSRTLVAANNLASYYDKLGHKDEAESILLMVVECAEKNRNKYFHILGTAYNSLAKWSLEKFDFQASLKYINKSYELMKDYLGDDNPFTIQSLYDKGTCLLKIGEISDGIDCINNALSQAKDHFGDNDLRYVQMMEVLPLIYSVLKDYETAISIEEERSEKLRGIVGEQDFSYLQSLAILSELYFLSGDTVKLHNILIDNSKMIRKRLVTDIPNYTTVEKEYVVNCVKDFFDSLFPRVCYYNTKPALYSELYNAILLRKGLLLNSEIEFSSLIRESGDSTLIGHYNQLIAYKNQLSKQYQLPEKQRVFNTDSLKHLINEKEDNLIFTSKIYGDYTQRFRADWKDIRKKLNNDELSVEFFDFCDTCAIQNRIYCALIVDNRSEYPELVPLCKETEIQSLLNSDDKERGLFQLIWNPIIQRRTNIKKIFFSPSGILNNIGIEYLEINGEKNISDQYALYRLSSTREIIEVKESVCKSAALYGGLNYSVDTDVLLAQNLKSGVEDNSSVMYRGLSDSLSVRNSFEPLYNTKKEISEIDKTLKKGNVDVSIYSETIGTEESFKDLSGKGINIIHLATHGMYIGASEAESKKKENNMSFIQLDENNRGQTQEDKSLSRSFLVMSGGDMLPTHKEIPENLEDGILTASEISKLDLRGLDMVVLSACQTALGDIDNEGVYGLQRGFKKAGANTILMSLDKVDDEATKILMVEFYRNLMSGNTKQQSLKAAQKHLRQVENGKYDKPEYWASFILLDGLN